MQLVRYLIRKSDASVFIWTQPLANYHKDLEEVYAPDAASALKAQPVPATDTITLAQLEEMKKADLIIFAQTRLGMELDQSKTKAVLLDEVKPVLFSQQGNEVMDTPGTKELDAPKGRRP